MPLSLHPVPCWSLLCSSVAGSNPDLGWEGHARHPHVDHDKLDGRRGDSPVRPRTRVLRTWWVWVAKVDSLTQALDKSEGVAVVAQSGNLSGGNGEDQDRKREMRLLKNREAARECRRKKKEYIKCLENRVAVLENQNKALIDELKSLKELYCQQKTEWGWCFVFNVVKDFFTRGNWPSRIALC